MTFEIKVLIGLSDEVKSFLETLVTQLTGKLPPQQISGPGGAPTFSAPAPTGMVTLGATPEVIPAGTPTGTPVPDPAPVVDKGSAKQIRKDLMARLDSLGIVYTAKMPTTQLAKLLEKAAADPDGKQPAAPPAAPAEPAVTSAPALTKEAVRQELVDALVRSGNDQVGLKKLLSDVAGVDKLSDVPAEKYPAIVEAAKKFGKK